MLKRQRKEKKKEREGGRDVLIVFQVSHIYSSSVSSVPFIGLGDVVEFIFKSKIYKDQRKKKRKKEEEKRFRMLH